MQTEPKPIDDYTLIVAMLIDTGGRSKGMGTVVHMNGNEIIVTFPSGNRIKLTTTELP